MLKGISPLVCHDLLALLMRMWHDDEIVHFPGESFNKNVLRADGLGIPNLLAAIFPLFGLDSYVLSPLLMMAAVGGDELDPMVEQSFLVAIHKAYPNGALIERIKRFAFYKHTKNAFCSGNDWRSSKIWKYHIKERSNSNSLKAIVL